MRTPASSFTKEMLSPVTSAADDRPKTGMSSVYGATVDASYRFSSHPHTPKPPSVEMNAT
ncbi:hypothetical protein GCM10018965_069620 [Nonomuraea roseola]